MGAEACGSDSADQLSQGGAAKNTKLSIVLTLLVS